jgi:hypothetical protein
VRLDGRSDFTHMVMSLVHLYVERDTRRSRSEAERSLELNAYFMLGRHAHGLALTYDGEPAAGVERLLSAAQATRRNVIHPRIMQGAAISAFLLDRFDEAADYAKRADQETPDVGEILITLAAVAAAAGWQAEARAAAEQLLHLFPAFRVATMRRWPFRMGAHHEKFVAALVAAGLPG